MDRCDLRYVNVIPKNFHLYGRNYAKGNQRNQKTADRENVRFYSCILIIHFSTAL